MDCKSRQSGSKISSQLTAGTYLGNITSHYQATFWILVQLQGPHSQCVYHSTEVRSSVFHLELPQKEVTVCIRVTKEWGKTTSPVQTIQDVVREKYGCSTIMLLVPEQPIEPRCLVGAVDLDRCSFHSCQLGGLLNALSRGAYEKTHDRYQGSAPGSHIIIKRLRFHVVTKKLPLVEKFLR